ncbi:MAG: hypothetical protein HN919_06975 [Verrucomicrobia bacterium]|jgi:hypothetical protein|nr:hypothetical protein [Verrucomicrobiota bacterium]MBT7066027.1 hypothetical protein [Verrucomicrobiota bacterium]MBT7700703.1 hypothetical protein [Verrucomicrobiota bacterium]
MRVTLALLLCTALLAGAEDAPETARDRAKRQLALRAAAQHIVDGLRTPPVLTDADTRTLVAELGARMQQNVKAHTDPVASRARCLKLLGDQRRQALDQWIDQAVARARQSSALPLRKEDVLRHIGDDWPQRASAAASAFAAGHIEAAFGQARKQCVALQRDEVKDLIRMPAEEAINPRLTALADASGHHPPHLADLDQLTEWLASLGNTADRPLFKEVEHSTRDAAEHVMQRVKQQYDRQLKAIKQAADALPPTALDAQNIRGALLAAAETATKTMRLEEMRNRPDSRAPIYGPLTVIQSEADRMATTMEEDRIDAAIRSQKDLPITAAAIASVLRSDLKAHATAKQSRGLLVTRYAGELKPWLIEQLAHQAGRADEGAFRLKIKALVEKNQRLGRTIDAHVGRTLDGVLPGLRQTLTADQLRAIFGDLPASIAMLAPEDVEAIWSAGSCETVKHFDSAWHSLQATGLIREPSARDDLLDEARRQVIATCNRLIPTACRAMRDQANQLSALEKEWTEQLRKDVESDRPVEKIATDWTRELDRRWRAYAAKEALPYPNLFARTLDLLDKTIRKLYESRKSEMEKESEAAAETPPEPAPEEEPPVEEPPPPEETLEDSAAISIQELLETLDFVLYFRDVPDGKSEAVLLDGDGTPTRLLFDPGSGPSAVEAVYQSIISPVTAAAQGKATQNPKRTGLRGLFQRSRSIDLKVAVLVGSQQVRHMMSILLRNRAELFVADWNANPANPTLELEWEDNVEVAP